MHPRADDGTGDGAPDPDRDRAVAAAEHVVVRVNGRVCHRGGRLLDRQVRVDRDVEADPLLRAADARVPDRDGPRARHLAEVEERAVGVRLRSLAAELVEAPAVAVTLVAERLREPARVEVRAALAVLVDHAAVGELRTAEIVERRQRAEGGELEDGAEQVVRVRRAAGQGHDGLALEELRDAGRAGRVRRCGRNAAPRGARADRDDRAGLGGDLVQRVDRLLAADLAVDAAVLLGNGALDDEDELALVLVQGLLERLLESGGRPPRTRSRDSRPR